MENVLHNTKDSMFKVKVAFQGLDANSCPCDYLKSTESNLYMFKCGPLGFWM